LSPRGPRCDVHVFLAAPPQQDARDLAQAWGVLDEDERRRADALLRESDRRAYVVSHALLRLVLARETGGDAGALQFSRTVYGRPQLVDRDGPTAGAPGFNLSHTRALVGCAIASAGAPAVDGVPDRAPHIAPEIGFDLEEALVPAPLDVASRYFSRDELARLKALRVPQQDRRFYALWTLKESYIKGRGLGLALPLDSFSVDPLPRGLARLTVHRPEGPRQPQPPAPDGASWTLRWWRFDAHLAALAVRCPSDRVQVRLHSGVRLAALARATS
jgi:4'-phosphopantetheinyl transferase